MADGYVDSFSSLSVSSQAKSSPRKSPSFHSASIQPPLDGLEYGINAQLHVVMVPYPVQGQINPMMQFAKLLTTRRDTDIVVTLVNNKHNHDSIQRTRSIAADHTDRSLHLTWVESGQLPPDFDYNDVGGTDHFQQLHESTVLMKEPLKQLLQRLRDCKSRPPVSCVLFGAFCPWAQSAAAELGIPNFLFWTQSASVFSIYWQLPMLATSDFFSYHRSKRLQGTCASDDSCVDTAASNLVTCIPGLPPLHPSSFPSVLHVDDISDPSLAIVQELLSLGDNSNGIIINSFQELEKDALQPLQQVLPYPVSFVGPLLPSAFLYGDDESTDKTSGASLLQERSDCIEWLDGKQKQSVLYISFGSVFKPSTAELEGIALGIKARKQPYLWVIRPSASFQDVSEILPPGFVEDTKDYGLIIPWAPQVQVLNHPAVGAFLTHCGWNSTLESLSMGMPMISYPILLDQPTNSACVCDVWKVGMALKRQGDGKVKREDVERVLRTVLHEDEGAQMRERAMKFRAAARRAVQAQGSSHADITLFIQRLTKF